MKNFKELAQDIVNRMDEDAPVNNVGSGNVDMNPTGAKMSPKMMKRKKEQGDEQDKIKKKIKTMLMKNEDNNNVIFKQINDSLEKVELKLDEQNYGDTTIEVVEEPEYKTFKDKYNA
jgi:hypothetical protein